MSSAHGEAEVIEALRSRALALIDEMLRLLTASPALREADPRAVHTALVTLVIREAVAIGARARGLTAGEGRLFDDGSCALLAEPLLRSTIAPAVEHAEAVLQLAELIDPGDPARDSRFFVEVLGFLYEGLIAYEIARDPSGSFHLARTRGRKRSGSYYTPLRICRTVVDRALAPILARIAALPGEEQAPALLTLRICDPAMGAGVFLIESAWRVAQEVSRVRGWEDPIRALRMVVTQCIYGCDMSALAVAIAEVSLWLLVGDPDLTTAAAGRGLRTGDALIGLLYDDLPRLRVDGRDVEERAEQLSIWDLQAPATAHADRLRLAADHLVGASIAGRRGRGASDEVDRSVHGILRGELSATSLADHARERATFHWPLELEPAASPAGFHVVLGNPPWVAFAGRASQPLDPRLRSYFAQSYEAWRGYPTLHGLFVERAARLAPLGVVALVIPSPVADLDGYRAVRRAVSRHHVVSEPLLEFGQDAFDDVVQPCIALIATPSEAPTSSDRAWRLEERQRAGSTAAAVSTPAVIEELSQARRLPAIIFREMGFQTTSVVSHTMLLRDHRPDSRHRVPLLEGRNVREFFVGEPGLFLAADVAALKAAGSRLRSLEEYQRVDFVVRQTAVAPIAALSTGLPFRNTLLAGFGHEDLSAELLVGLLNSALYRAFHLATQRDARQATFPQVKVAHLRQLPLPPRREPERCRIVELCERLAASAQEGNGDIDLGLRAALDDAVFDLFGISISERQSVLRFLAERAPSLRYAST